MSNKVRIILEDVVGVIDWIGATYYVPCRDGETRQKRDLRVKVQTNRSGKDTVQYYHLTTWGKNWYNEINTHQEGDTIQFDLEILGRPYEKNNEPVIDKYGNVCTFTELSPLPKKWPDDPDCGYIKTLQKKTIDKIDDSNDGIDVIPKDDLPF